MLYLFDKLSEIMADTIVFPALQLCLVMFVLFAVLHSWIPLKRNRRGKSKVSVIRGEVSMNYFYAAYAVINGLLVAICLSVDITKNHRVIWVIIDTILVAYLCIFNQWFRNILIGWIDRISKIEK
jgi:hypothetical protein